MVRGALSELCTSKIIFELTGLSVQMSVTSRNGHSGSVVYQGPDKVILSNFNVILFCRPGGARVLSSTYCNKQALFKRVGQVFKARRTDGCGS